MNRRHTAADYLRLVDKIRRIRRRHCPVGRLHRRLPRARRTADFAATLALVREVGYAQAFSFKYSPRPGTPAAALPDQVAEAVKDERLQRLQRLLAEQQAAFAAGLVGRDDRPADREARPPGGPAGRPLPLAAAGDC